MKETNTTTGDRRPTLLAAALLAAVPALAACGGGEPAPESDEASGDSVPEAPGEWEVLAPVPEARTEVSVSTDGERVYLAGGFLAPPADHPEDERPPAARKLLVHDPAEDAWSEAGEIPVGTHHAGLLPVDGKLYLVGGYRDNSFEPRSGEVWIYDPETGEWSEGSPMPTPRGALAYAVLDGKIHTIGGTVADPDALDTDEHSVSDEDESVGTHEVYDPETDAWERRAPMPTARNHHGAGAVDGRIVVTAGRVGDRSRLTATEVWDAETDTWSEADPLPTGRSGVASAVLDGEYYVFGGEAFGNGGARVFVDAERFDPATGSWERLPPMPTGRHGVGAAVLDGAIHVVSGGPSPGFNYGTANERLVP